MADIEMTMDSIRVSLMNYQHVMVLKERKGERILPIWTGQAEADAIQVKLTGMDLALARPMTHDLMCTFADIAGWKITSAKIYRLENDCFYAVLVIDSSGKRFEVDCRPSDAIAVAIRTQAPIFAAEEVLEKAGILIERETGKPLQAKESVTLGEIDNKDKIKLPGIRCHRCDSDRVYPAYSDRKVCDNCGLIFT
jgi:bifunctional DNase/RNase